MKRKRHTDETIALAEEQLTVEKVEKPRERVTVRVAPIEREERVEVALSEEHVDIERIEVNRRVDSRPAVREENGVLIVPIVEEVAVVEKQLVLREELHIRRRQEQRREQRTVTLRSEEAQVEREDLNEGENS